MPDRFSRLKEVLASTPWWAISVAFHIALLAILWRINFRIDIPRTHQEYISVRPTISETIDHQPVIPVIREKKPFADVNPVAADVQQDIVNEDHPDEQLDMAQNEDLSDTIEGIQGLAAIAIPDGFTGPNEGPGPKGPKQTYNTRITPGDKINKIRENDAEDTIEPVRAGLLWLAKHQSPDGGWHPDAWMNECPAGRSCVGHGGGKINDVGKADATAITGIVLLAFLGDGNTHQTGTYRKTVKAGLEYLRKSQDSKGKFQPGNMYTHGIAALAAVEAYGMTRARSYKPMAQKAVDYICKTQNPLGGWDYISPSERNDMSVSGWQIMTLKSAWVSNLTVPRETMDRIVRWLDIATDETTGSVAYEIKGNNPKADFPGGGGTIRMRAAGMLCHLFFGKDQKAPMMLKSGDEFLKHLTVWQGEENNGKVPGVDLYYWYYATLVNFQLKGKYRRVWDDAMKKTLLGSQVKNSTHALGSWPPVDEFSSHWSRPGATALSILCLEVYYRYPDHWIGVLK